MTKRFEVIISDNSIIYHAICENIENSDAISLISGIDDISRLLKYPKIDLLICETPLASSSLPLYKIKTLINLTDNAIIDNEIKLSKPVYLKEILHLIKASRLDNLLFVLINNQWIYNERTALLLDGNKQIKLTENENAVIRELLLSANSILSKTHLEQKIWLHYEHADSNTIDVHLYKLKQKLPDGLLDFDKHSVRLNLH